MKRAGEAVSQAKSAVVPEWVDRHFRSWEQRTVDVVDLMDAAAHGISVLPNVEILLEVMNELPDPEDADADWHRHRAAEFEDVRSSAAKAQKILPTEFRLLHQMATVWLWVSLEAFVADLVTDALHLADPTRFDPMVRDLKVPWHLAAQGDADAIARAVLAEIEARKGSAFKSGVTRFDGLLSLVGFGGSVPDDVQKDLYELGQVRNVILHRGGAVDQGFLDACPWFDAPIGKAIVVSHHRVEEYAFAAMHYVALVRSRISSSGVQ